MAVLAIATFVVALAMVHTVMLKTGFALVQSTPHDTRLNHYILEYEYRWLRGEPGASSLWDPPVMYPLPGGLASQDLLLSFGPPYFVARMLGLDAEAAYQAWLLCLTTINVGAALLFFRRVVGAPPIASAVGALVFCVAAPRMLQFDHHQLYPQLYLLVLAAAVVQILRQTETAGRPRFSAWPPLAAVALALQAWGGYYLFFFSVLTLCLGAVVGLCFQAARGSLRRAVRQFWPSFLLAGVLFVALVAPLAKQYLGALAQLGPRSYEGLLFLIARPQSWLYPGNAFASRWLVKLSIFQGLPSGEHVMGVGILTTLVAAVGLWMWRRDARARWLAAVVAVMVVLATVVGGRSLWWFVWSTFPGAQAVRAVTRIWLITILPLSLAVAAVVARVERVGRWPAALVLGGLCVAEQAYPTIGYDKAHVRAQVEQIAAAIPIGKKAFFSSASRSTWVQRVHYEGIWASLVSGVPTLNAVGSPPLSYDLIALTEKEGELKQAEERLRGWCSKHGIALEDVAWIHDATFRRFSSVSTTEGAQPESANGAP